MIVLTFQRSLSQITYFCEKLFFPQNRKMMLLCANKREYRISPEIVSQLACAAITKSTNTMRDRLQTTNNDFTPYMGLFPPIPAIYQYPLSIPLELYQNLTQNVICRGPQKVLFSKTGLTPQRKKLLAEFFCGARYMPADHFKPLDRIHIK